MKELSCKQFLELLNYTHCVNLKKKKVSNGKETPYPCCSLPSLSYKETACVLYPFPCSTNRKYVAINYPAASAAESKFPECSDSMTHQTVAVQGAASENITVVYTAAHRQPAEGFVYLYCSLVVIVYITALFT